jgi:hypothetical protein
MRLTMMVVATLAGLLLTTGRAQAQHLWWDTNDLKDATCLYGEITVLATYPEIYYCGANWHPGEPAGGYCGIQHNGPEERRTIFSIWDTSPELHPSVTEADTQTVHDRFGGEGEGSHTHMSWDWNVGDTFQFFVWKQPGPAAGTTDARYYIYDRGAKQWRHSATITCPNGDEKSRASVATVGGRKIASFLENFGGKDQEVPKLALYRLWLGNSADSMHCLTRAKGDGTWGRLHDAYFLAEGGKKELEKLFGGLGKTYGEPVFGGEGKTPDPISDRPLPVELIRALKTLPRAAQVKDK